MAELQDPEVFRAVLDSLQTGVLVADRNGKILFWNQGAERITGFIRHQVLGHFSRDNILVHCNHQGCEDCGASCPLAITLRDGKPREGRLRLRHRDGHPLMVVVRTVAVRDSHGSVVAVAQSFDVQKFEFQRDRNQRNLAGYGCLDEATGVPNRSFTQFHLRESLASFETYHLPFGILHIQVEHLDRFRTTYGQRAGDAVLKVVAETVSDGLRPSDFFGRWAEDQFLCILMNCGHRGVERTCQRLRKVAACAGLRWWGDELPITTSLRYATAQPGDSIDSLLQRACGLPGAASPALSPDACGLHNSES
jgi:diguanylate cyclase (GGDEF)-like protein/PAS domain S-box-containing protein